MEPQEFQARIANITAAINGRALEQDLETFLNDRFPADGETFKAIESACHQAIEDGWGCASASMAASDLAGSSSRTKPFMASASMLWKWMMSPGPITATRGARLT